MTRRAAAPRVARGAARHGGLKMRVAGSQQLVTFRQFSQEGLASQIGLRSKLVMRRHELTSEEWQKLEKILPKGVGRPPKLSDRRFINAVLWKVKTGVPWRDRPRRYGKWKTVYSRFSGLWPGTSTQYSIFDGLQTAVDDNWNAIDGTYIRVHQHAAGGKGGPTNSALDAAVEDTLQRSIHAWMHRESRGRSR